MKQLVLSGNRIIAHGEDCFLAMGGTVICPESGRVYQNATVANIEGGIPSDIDEVGYEYHAGEFVPCAPYGKGSGNVAVVCNDDCKSIKDSGKSAKNLGNVAVVDYIGTGTETVTIETDFEPLFAIVCEMDDKVLASTRYRYSGVITQNGGFTFEMTQSTSNPTTVATTPHLLFSEVVGNALTWRYPASSSSKDAFACNTNKKNYKAIIVGRA